MQISLSFQVDSWVDHSHPYETYISIAFPFQICRHFSPLQVTSSNLSSTKYRRPDTFLRQPWWHVWVCCLRLKSFPYHSNLGLSSTNEAKVDCLSGPVPFLLRLPPSYSLVKTLIWRT